MLKILKQTMLKYGLYNGIGTSMFSFLKDSEQGRTYKRTTKTIINQIMNYKVLE